MALQDVRAAVRRVAKRQGLDEQAVENVLEVNAEHSFEVQVGDKVYHGYRAQHDNRRGPYKGGIRFHPEVSLDEVRSLATLMSLKTAAVGLPLGGGKGGVAVDAKSLSEEELEQVAREFVRQLAKHIGPDVDVPAPDVNTNPKVIDWMVDEYEQLTGDTTKASFTGKSLERGGSEGRTAATGRGGVIVLHEVLKHLNKTKVTVAVQGYGNVGSYFATVAQTDEPDWTLVAATDSSGGRYSKDGLDAKQLAEFKEQRGKLAEFNGGEQIDADDIVGVECDVLVLSALGDAVNTSNMRDVKASIILELANEPLSGEAHDYLTKQGVLIVPDILANAGGVIVSYLEWLQNKQGEHWDEVRVNTELARYLVEATEAAWHEYTVHKHESLSDAAITVALKRLIEESA